MVGDGSKRRVRTVPSGRCLDWSNEQVVTERLRETERSATSGIGSWLGTAASQSAGDSWAMGGKAVGLDV